MDKENFLSQASERRKKFMESIVLEVLTKMLNDDLKYFDAHYIQNRSLEIIERTIKKLKFTSDDVQRARRAFLDVLIDGAQKQLYGFEDDYNQAKKDIKDKGEKKRKAIEILKKIERMKNKVPQGLSEQRDMDCEPVCQMIASKVLSKDLILKDEEYVNNCIEMDNGLLLSTLYRPLFEELFDQLITSLDRSYIEANTKNWGCRRDEIKLKQIDNRLKS